MRILYKSARFWARRNSRFIALRFTRHRPGCQVYAGDRPRANFASVVRVAGEKDLFGLTVVIDRNINPLPALNILEQLIAIIDHCAGGMFSAKILPEQMCRNGRGNTIVGAGPGLGEIEDGAGAVSKASLDCNGHPEIRAAAERPKRLARCLDTARNTNMDARP